MGTGHHREQDQRDDGGEKMKPHFIRTTEGGIFHVEATNSSSITLCPNRVDFVYDRYDFVDPQLLCTNCLNIMVDKCRNGTLNEELRSYLINIVLNGEKESEENKKVLYLVNYKVLGYGVDDGSATFEASKTLRGQKLLEEIVRYISRKAGYKVMIKSVSKL
jgi:hypothetical protein